MCSSKLSRMVLGVFALIFGLCGTLLPLHHVTFVEFGNKYSPGTLMYRATALIAVLMHLYLTTAGWRLLRQPKSRLLRYFFGLEALYFFALLLILPPLASTGYLSKYELEQILIVSAGFTAQFVCLFPLWQRFLAGRLFHTSVPPRSTWVSCSS